MFTSHTGQSGLGWTALFVYGGTHVEISNTNLLFAVYRALSGAVSSPELLSSKLDFKKALTPLRNQLTLHLPDV
jgi:hypothetical protein